MYSVKLVLAATATMMISCLPLSAQEIQHDAGHYVLLHQYGDQWAAEDKRIDEKLAEIREKNGAKPPNIVYILIDDMGFGEFGMPELNKIWGGRTPNLDEFANEGMTFTRFYAENICTSTRVAFMTGRYAVRTGMELTKVTPLKVLVSGIKR
jgi:arylsulfatase